MIFRQKHFSTIQIRQLRDIIKSNWNADRRSIIQAICVALNWRDKSGGLREDTCRQFLNHLKKKGIIKLPVEMVFRGRTITESDVTLIKRIISRNADKGRVYISKEICSAWSWSQKNGILQDQVCRSLLVILEKEGIISLPPKKRTPPNNVAKKKPAKYSEIDPSQRALTLQPDTQLRADQVRREPWEKTFDGMIERFHHQGYRQSPGAHLKYVVFAGETPVACASFCSAPRHISDRNAFLNLGSDANIVSNDRFLILPWVTVNESAGRILLELEQKVTRDWRLYYRMKVQALDAYVETEDDATPYRQAGWELVGQTKGIARNRKDFLPSKEVYVKLINKEEKL